MLSRRQLLVATALSAGYVTFVHGQSSDYPRGPVKLIIPGSAGGPTDNVARLVGQGLEALWKQPVVFDYKPGAGALLGITELAKSPPDGYTLALVGASGYVVNTLTQKKLSFDPVRDITGVALLTEAGMVILATPSAPFNTLPELIAYAKNNPGKLSFGTSGIKGTAHLAGELLNKAAGIDMQVVGYKGTTPSFTDLMAGHIPLAFDTTSVAMPFVTAGRMKVIATLGTSRDPLLPNVPAVSETYPSVTMSSFWGLVAPGKTPRPIIDQIARDVGKVIVNTPIGEKIAQTGMQLHVGGPDALNEKMQRAAAAWGGIVKELKLDAD
jgi:tripartite-type tricarboxylate transporter receptor subunit TctC